ncbi:MAG: DNA-directed DNA polymerase II small subunit [Methanonatronarchaeia archaeon]|nr:MAG: DNA-directed DNA polymerase II small subunit [Methanonatronarchaeia archaeon]
MLSVDFNKTRSPSLTFGSILGLSTATKGGHKPEYRYNAETTTNNTARAIARSLKNNICQGRFSRFSSDNAIEELYSLRRDKIFGLFMEIVEKCIEQGIFLHPDAKQKLEEQEDPSQLIDKILKEYNFENPVLLPKHIEQYTTKNPGKPKQEKKVESITPKKPRKPEKKETTKKEPEDEPEPVETQNGGIEVVLDVTGRSECEGELKNFYNYFNDRYEKIKKEITKRNGMRNARPVEAVKRGKEDVSVVGIVNEVRGTQNGHKLILLEDMTGEIPTLALKNRDVYSKSEEVLLDEVIGVRGALSDGSDLLMLDDIVWPDLPLSGGKPQSKGDGYIAFISDVHFGSTTFLEDAWNRFVNWLNGEYGGPEHQELVKNIKYLCIAGDLVEGIGIYPGQKEELKTVSITEQYREAARQLKRLPSHINIIISPGNHDAVRQAEPQPAFDEEIQEVFVGEMDNITFVGNPSTIKIAGVEILVYHGRSLDDLIAELPKRSYEKPAEVMSEYVKRRHLAPIYGKKTPLAPENKDYHYVDKPDIIHCGHVHKFGVDQYKGVNLFNTGTWQRQTKFQKKKGIKPDPGRVVLYSLENHEPKIVKFCN